MQPRPASPLSLLALLSACSAQPLDGPAVDDAATMDLVTDATVRDAGNPVDRAVGDLAAPADLVGPTDLAERVDGAPPDAEPTFSLHLSWQVQLHDQPATCDAAGVSTIELRGMWGGNVHMVLGTFPCGNLDGVLGPFPSSQANSIGVLNVAAYDQGGNFVTEDGRTAYLAEAQIPEWEGPLELGQSLIWVSGEPIPEMRQIFQAANAWWAKHGALPDSVTWTPGQGACCAQEQEICGVRASADLDCNGVFSNYEMFGTFDGNGFTGIDDVKITDPEE